MPFEDLENLFAWGLLKNGGSTIQTNGALIEDRHIELFRKYKVQVGISIDGPGELNDVRWNHSLQKTRESTARVEKAIATLCREYQPPGLIITLHKGNATAEKMPIMANWMKELDGIGVRSVRLHLLEVDEEAVRNNLALSARENIEALLAFARLGEELKGMRFDLFQEMERLLTNQDANASCVWRACDPYTTEAVQGIEGSGQSSNCGRTNKEGVDFIKAAARGYERYVALYNTPQSDKGCAGCRFFLMCKGQCPGTAIAGDWRNRTEHCEEWKQLFTLLEKKIILSGKVPLTLQPIRQELERRQLAAWEAGQNPSVGRTYSLLMQEINNPAIVAPEQGNVKNAITPPVISPKPVARISWVSEKARNLWQGRIESIRVMLEDMTVYTAVPGTNKCTVRRVPAASFERLFNLSNKIGIGATTLPDDALPGAICTEPGVPSGIFMAGDPSAIASAEAAWATGDLASLYALLDIPDSCLHHASKPDVPATIETAARTLLPDGDGHIYLPDSITTHPLLAHLGISILPVTPGSLHCPEDIKASEQFLQLATIKGYIPEVAAFWECMSWAISWSEYHGITEVKTPVFKMCILSGSFGKEKTILREGASIVQCGATGLSFPFAKPSRKSSKSTIITA
jgi:uncharacterized protein